VLRAAIISSESLGDPDGTAELEDRWESAERGARVRDLARARERLRMGDEDGLRAACAAWVGSHSVLDFDDDRGRAEVAALLRMWPREPGGSWREDPRARLVRFFLDGREGSVDGRALERSVEALEGAPEPVLARAKLLAGDAEGAERVASSSPTLGAFEWTTFLAEAGRRHLRGGRNEEARRALSRIAPAARGECEVLLFRRDLERSIAGPALSDAPALDLDRTRRERFPAEMWSSRGMLPLCLDPEWTAGRVLEVDIGAAGPSVVAWGWNDGRRGSIRVRRSARLRVSLAGLSGLRTFWARATHGGPVTAAATIVREEPALTSGTPENRAILPNGPLASGTRSAPGAPYR
jgi:hypothetical protein